MPRQGKSNVPWRLVKRWKKMLGKLPHFYYIPISWLKLDTYPPYCDTEDGGSIFHRNINVTFSRYQDSTLYMSTFYYNKICWCRTFRIYWIILTWNLRNIFLLGGRGILLNLVDWGTVLQAVRSLVQFPVRSLGFPIYLILLPALWPWDRLSL
jgi:hypothetical protein